MSCLSARAIEAQYLSMVPLRNFTWTGNSTETITEFLQSQEVQLKILDLTPLKSGHLVGQSFIIINQCEASGYEIADEIYEAYTALLSREPQDATSDCYKTYILSDGKCCITLKESVKMISEGTTGLNTWPAASFMAEWSVNNSDIFAGRVVLELGSGMGLTGLTICKMCAPSQYVFSDCHMSILANLLENVALNIPGYAEDNGCREETLDGPPLLAPPLPSPPVLSPPVSGPLGTVPISVEYIDWEEVDEQEVKKWNAGVILATDIVYDTRIIEPLVRLLRLLLRCQGDARGRPTAYIASTVRNDETYRVFLQALSNHGILSASIDSCHQPTLYYDRSCPIRLLCLRLET